MRITHPHTPFSTFYSIFPRSHSQACLQSAIIDLIRCQVKDSTRNFISFRNPVLHQTATRSFSAEDSSINYVYEKDKNIYSLYSTCLHIRCSTRQITAEIKYRKEISQYGITWSFEKPVKSGQFITGDWWVIGPVKIIKIAPEPGPVRIDNNKIQTNRWGDTSLKVDTLMRNGSMIVYKAGNFQGYDSRNGSYRASCSVKLPLVLGTNLSLVSTISNKSIPVDNFCKNIMWEEEKQVRVTLKTAAILTCLKKVPPADAFRPPFTGHDKPIFRAKDIQWELLPKLKPAGDVPSWEEFENYFSRCWIDHLMSWEQQELVPNENMPNYGREHARLISIASLMLSLDVPGERKGKVNYRTNSAWDRSVRYGYERRILE